MPILEVQVKILLRYTKQILSFHVVGSSVDRALNILFHPLPEKADELGLSIRVREVAGSNPAPPPNLYLNFYVGG